MRRIMVVMLAAMLLVSFSFAMAQEKGPKPDEQSQSPTMGPGSMQGGMPSQPPGMGQGSMMAPQLMQQMQDTMQQMQGMMRKPKVTTAEMKQLQDMLNQMQGMMNQMQINTMMQRCWSCPMVKQTPPTGSTMPQPGSPQSESTKPGVAAAAGKEVISRRRWRAGEPSRPDEK